MQNASESEKDKQRRLFGFLRHVGDTKGSLIILGDLFDFYFEYTHMIPKAYFEFFTELFQLKNKGVEIHYVLGNHDYWVQEFITETLTTQTYFDDTVFEVGGRTFYVTHGDGLLSWDRGYRVFKTLIRNRFFIWCFRWLHPTIGYRLANWISKGGRHYEHPDEYNERVLDELVRKAETHTSNGVDYLITGHYHLGINKTVKGGKLLVLGDWIRMSSYGYFDGHDLVIKEWNGDA